MSKEANLLSLVFVTLICTLSISGCENLAKNLEAMGSQSSTTVPSQRPSLARSSVARNEDGVEMIVTTTPSAAAPGERIRYEITFRNGGAKSGYSDARATIPNYTTVALVETTGGARCSDRGLRICPPGQEIHFENYHLGAGNTVTLHFNALVNNNPAAPSSSRLQSVITSMSLGMTVYGEAVVQ
jgi:hypothetical protein